MQSYGFSFFVQLGILRVYLPVLDKKHYLTMPFACRLRIENSPSQVLGVEH
ncbi:hypothetical protein PPEP_a0665 [Pseudoalteromonas peptidolytica F12-50-A1]|uniref:Uncharacterized protein n=1 Tax=Pseudoalteromonas peptidolytica F12-50-A1 TaxID=1315280 RepID=A0A8I0T426_9GAMM|nr:hypothetical protein [Pseudoalteromonas peptidolytica F12-50-A1]